MPCGWKCGAKLTAGEVREHFRECKNRPAEKARASAE